MPCSRLLTLAHVCSRFSHGFATASKFARAPDTFFHTLILTHFGKLVLEQQLPVQKFSCHLTGPYILTYTWQNSFEWENRFPSPCQSLISKVDPQFIKLRVAPIQWQWWRLAKPGLTKTVVMKINSSSVVYILLTSTVKYINKGGRNVNKNPYCLGPKFQTTSFGANKGVWVWEKVVWWCFV